MQDFLFLLPIPEIYKQYLTSGSDNDIHISNHWFQGHHAETIHAVENKNELEIGNWQQVSSWKHNLWICLQFWSEI